ncbi:MAG: hypothetical protein ACLGHQ_15170, partial [Acidimicrobiia bacterium]
CDRPHRSTATGLGPSRPLSGTTSGIGVAEPATVSVWLGSSGGWCRAAGTSLVAVVYDRRWRGFVVGLRERILRLLDTDGADLDPDEFVEFAVVKLGAGPLLVERLRQAGIEAHGHETVNPATTMLTDYSVSVRRRDLAAAAKAYNV